jgi:hypothetical protein
LSQINIKGVDSSTGWGMSQPGKIVERFLAHAELCQKLASECWSEELAEGLMQLARDSFEAARLASVEEAACVVPIKRAGALNASDAVRSTPFPLQRTRLPPMDNCA